MKDRRAIRLLLLMAEIDAVQKCMLIVHEQFGSLCHPALVQLSQLVDQKLNELQKLSKTC